jgi:ubiquinone/menaquinone biosynthesis C-methylase UbiE
MFEMAFEQLKERQALAWGNGKFEKVSETIADVHDAIVEALRPQAGERWLDLACGTGAVAERAAGAGATVTGIDFAPVLIETAKQLAQEKGLDIDYRVGDAEDLADVEDESFDVVSSSFGVIFGPDHRAVARELARVTPRRTSRPDSVDAGRGGRPPVQGDGALPAASA